jgi:sulfate adenylyltransferase subunit 1
MLALNEAAVESIGPLPPGADAEATGAALRLLTAGSVDDGKSTLIGRLLLDGRGVLADQLQALQQRAAGAPIDLSLLTDGLEAEREQGITIDVAYRYFSTPRRKFVIADAPGHEQYTHNMVTAAAGSDVAVVLVDATKLDLTQPLPALLPQTRRHALLAQLLRVPHTVFAVNKLDALEAAPGGAEQAFRRVAAALQAFTQEAGLPLRGTVPISALRGDNVAVASAHWPWYAGPTLLALLETLPVAQEDSTGTALLPVQYVAREDTGGTGGVGQQRRVLWGRLARGRLQPGARVRLFPGGQHAVVAEVLGAGQALLVPEAARAGRSVGVVLDRALDVSRGDWLLADDDAADAPRVEARLSATLAWLDTEPAIIGRRYWLRHGARWVAGRITAITHRLDIHNLQQQPAERLEVNEIGGVVVQLQEPLPWLDFAGNRTAGAAILVDPSTHRTSAALLARP